MQSIKLFCIPYAGGSSFLYYRWKKYMSSSIKLHPIELSGRGKRLGQPLYNSMEEAVEDVYDIIVNSLNNSEYAIFGHSMGSIIAYEVSRRLIRQGYKPTYVFCSGRKALHLEYSGKNVHDLPEEQFKKEILKLGGTPKELLDNQVLMNVFTPILRADYKIAETYRFSHAEGFLDCPLAVLYGDEDKMIRKDEIEEWSKYTKNRFKVYEFKGGHFFINNYGKEICDIINQSLTNNNY